MTFKIKSHIYRGVDSDMFRPHRCRGANYFTAVVSVFFMSTKQNELIPRHAYWLIFKQLTPVQGRKQNCKTTALLTVQCDWGKVWPGGEWWMWKLKGRSQLFGFTPAAPRATSITYDDGLLKSLQNTRRAGTQSFKTNTLFYREQFNRVSLRHFGLSNYNTPGAFRVRFRDCT